MTIATSSVPPRTPRLRPSLRWACAALACLLAGAACGKSSRSSPTAPSTPTSPGAPAPAPALALQPPTDFLMVGAVEDFSAVAISATGAAPPVATWGSDNPDVVSVSPAGRATAVSSGDATIFAEAMGQRASRLVQVAPEYAGSWGGTYRVQSCTATGPLGTGACTTTFPAGTRLPITLAAAQTRRSVSATITLGQLAGPVEGDIQPAGALRLAGAFDVTVNGGTTLNLEIADWRSRADQQQMTGTFTQRITSATLAGLVTVVGQLSPPLARGAVAGGSTISGASAPAGAGLWRPWTGS